MKEFLITWEKQELIISDDQDVIIGRNPGSDIYYADKRLSREHAKISRKGDSLYLEDLGSSNGTLLNNRLIKGQEELGDRDRVVAGPLHITVRITEKAAEKPDFKCPKCDGSVSEDAKFCPHCGESLENMVSVRTCKKCKAELTPGALFCPQCGDSIKEIVLGTPPKSDGSSLRPSATGPRIISGLVDFFITAVLAAALVVVPALLGYIITADIESGEGFSFSNSSVFIPAAGGGLLFIMVYAVLYGYLWGVKGRSPGMSITGIQVVNYDGKNIGFGKGVVRALLSLLFPGWLLLFLNSKKQALHDMAAGSMVIT